MDFKIVAKEIPFFADVPYKMSFDNNFIAIAGNGFLITSSNGGDDWVTNLSVAWTNNLSGIKQIGSDTWIWYNVTSPNVGVRVTRITQFGGILFDEYATRGGYITSIADIIPLSGGQFGAFFNQAGTNVFRISNNGYTYIVSAYNVNLGAKTYDRFSQKLGDQWNIYFSSNAFGVGMTRLLGDPVNNNFVQTVTDRESFGDPHWLVSGGAITMGEFGPAYSTNFVNFLPIDYGGLAEDTTGVVMDNFFSLTENRIRAAMSFTGELWDLYPVTVEGADYDFYLDSGIKLYTNLDKTAGLMRGPGHVYYITFELASGGLPIKGAYDRLVVNTMNHARFLSLK